MFVKQSIVLSLVVGVSLTLLSAEEKRAKEVKTPCRESIVNLMNYVVSEIRLYGVIGELELVQEECNPEICSMLTVSWHHKHSYDSSDDAVRLDREKAIVHFFGDRIDRSYHNGLMEGDYLLDQFQDYSSTPMNIKFQLSQGDNLELYAVASNIQLKGNVNVVTMRRLINSSLQEDQLK